MTATYTVNSWDVCCSGNERLRNRDEFMIAVSVSCWTTRDELRGDMKHDIQTYMQPEWFDYDACNAAIDAFCDQFQELPFPNLEDAGEGEDEFSVEYEGCYLYAYLQAPCEVPVY